MRYHAVIPKNVQKRIDKLEAFPRGRIIASIAALEEDPYLGKKLRGKHGGERSYTVWPLRIVYEIKEDESLVFILKVGHRKDVYR